jgi:pantoate--beta-alanine ligase
MTIRVVRTVGELRRWRAELGMREVALVPTMGFLHEGHVELLREGRRRGRELHYHGPPAPLESC